MRRIVASGWLFAASFVAALLVPGAPLPARAQQPHPPAPLARPALPAGKPSSPPAPRTSPAPAPARAEPAAHPAGASANAERAVVYDDRARPVAKDLLLTLESERKSEALARYAQGLLLEEDADTDQATKAYLKALALDPGNVDLALKLTNEYLRRGDAPEAIEVLKDAIKASPRASQPYLALDYLYLRYLNKPEQAQKYAAQALELDPTNWVAYQHLVEIYQALNQPGKANALLERGARVETKDANFWLRLGGIHAGFLFKDGKPASPEDVKRTAAVYAKALAVAGEEPGVVEQVANFYALTEQLAEAAALYEKVLRLDATNSNAADKLGRCYLALGQREQAIGALEKSIKANPTQQAAYELLGELYREDNQFEKAADQYEQCLRLDPDKEILYQRLAALLLDGRPQHAARAVEVLTKARKRFPNRLAFGEWLGVALALNKQHQQAMTVFEQTLVESRANQESFLSDGTFYFEYGAAAEQAGLYEKAATLFKKTLDVGNDSDLIAKTCNYLGYMWIDRNENLEEAGALVRRALDLRPDSGAFLDSLGWYYYRTNQFDKAVTQLLQAAANTEPPDATIFEHLGDTYLKLDNSAQALAYWQKAAALESANPADKERVVKKIESAKSQVAQGTRPPGGEAPPP